MTDGGYGPPQGGNQPAPPPQGSPQAPYPPQPQAPGAPQQPYAPQAQQPYPPQAQQQYPPQQQYGQPPQQPKKRRGLVIGLVVGLLLLCVLAGCAALLIGGALSGGGTKKSVAQAEQHFSTAMSAVETASASIKSAPGDPAKAGAALADANKALRTGRDELAAARAAIEPLESSRGKAQYLASLTAATEALDALQDMIAYLGTASGMMGKVQEAGKTASRANDELNDAISAGNRSDYGTMKSKAGAASADYGRAAQMFREAHKLDKSAGLDKAAGYAAKRKEQADLVRQMADEGDAGRVGAYNKDIGRMKDLARQAEAIGDPAIVSDPQWARKRLADLEKRILEAGATADEQRAVALKEFGVIK